MLTQVEGIFNSADIIVSIPKANKNEDSLIVMWGVVL